jgi:hypothetical protein
MLTVRVYFRAPVHVVTGQPKQTPILKHGVQ